MKSRLSGIHDAINAHSSQTASGQFNPSTKLRASNSAIHPHLLSAWFGQPKRRTLRRILALLLSITIIITSVGFWLFRLPKKAQAVWYDDNWTYRVPITITHNASVTNTKVKFDIDTSTPITNGKMQSDCGDSRFTDVNGNLLRYFIDTAGGACNGASTDYYVLIPTIINGTTIIYHYYGNPSAENGTESSQFSESTTTPSGALITGSEQKSLGPAAYWKLDEGQSTTVQDSTLNDVDGTITGADWKNEDLCLSGKCLFFDGSDQVVRATEKHSVDLGSTNDSYSVSAWVRTGADFTSAVGSIVAKFDNAGTPNTFSYLLYLDTSEFGCFAINDATNTASACGSTALNDNKWHLLTGVRSVSDDKVYIYVVVEDRNGADTSAGISTFKAEVPSASGGYFNFRAPDNTINTTKWYHLVVTYNSSEGARMYVDGVKQTISTVGNSSGNYVPRNSNLYLGSINDNTYGFNGKLDEVRIYNRALSDAEVRQLYNFAPSLIGRWKMEETSANTCTGGVNDSCDSSGNAYDGAWNGNATSTTGKFGAGVTFDGTGDYVDAGDIGL